MKDLFSKIRKTISLNGDWDFFSRDIGVIEAECRKGEKVDIPHTWNAVDGQTAKTWHGKCWYSKRFSRADVKDDECAFLEFKGINSVADVYINGYKAYTHKGGYSAFRVEITHFLQEDNTVLVCVDNTITDEVYPNKADFTFYGGIYRDVNLIITNKTHFDLLYYGGYGIKVDAQTDGTVSVVTYSNGGEAKVEVFDNQNRLVVQGSGGQKMTVKNPHLWNGRYDPYLYTAVAVLYENGIEVDRVRTSFGFREFKIDPLKGFFLNGKSYPLRGVCCHQDRLNIGNALSIEHHKEDIELICEMGANCVRLAHYQQDESVYELCDKYGLVVWSEIPYISRHTDVGAENCFSQMRELIVQTYNHPSIVCRGISNEIVMCKSRGRKLTQTHEELYKICKTMDPMRYVSIAFYSLTDKKHPIIKCCDIMAHNLYGGWYGGNTAWNGKQLDKWHELYPDIPQGLSEYGADCLPDIHSLHPKKGDLSEEYQAVFHEKLLEIIENRPYLWGTFLWNMFDFGADRRKGGLAPGKNLKGLVTFDRKIKKDAFYLYQAYWSSDPFVHICGKRFSKRVGNVIIIKVYTNCKTCKLYNNGQFIEEKDGKHIFEFKIKSEKYNCIVVTSGKVQDKITIEKVSRLPKEYKGQNRKTKVGKSYDTVLHQKIF